jgi:hypothetical protein
MVQRYKTYVFRSPKEVTDQYLRDVYVGCVFFVVGGLQAYVPLIERSARSVFLGRPAEPVTRTVYEKALRAYCHVL